ncbi:unnamed protein product [Ceutorhynchus assimilis]|uniref:Uncharacterized protein n=1 Tax=Ceutorhynchus assimilis TaxID=467358 RepID=A0A9N9MHK3_9CUCU|nr:unnamed protein product [Ceutorhynchus assimilis]
MCTEGAQLINLPSEQSETEFTEMISINIICRICANQSDKLIGIYTEDGLSNDLAEKINIYLPVHVEETDILPLQCCWQCASTVLAWHELILTSLEADRRLRSYQFVTEKQLQEITSGYGNTDNLLATTNDYDEETLLATDSISKDTVQYETINNTELAIQETEIEDPKFIIDEEQKVEKKINLPVEGTLLSHNDIKIQTIEVKIDTVKSDSEEEKESLYKFKCLYCPTLFLTMQDEEQHVKTIHPNENPKHIYFNENDSQEKSIKEENVIVKTPKTTDKSDIGLKAKHMIKHPIPKINPEEVKKAKVVVDGRTFYICKECGKSLHSMYTYMWHTRIHTGERPYVCNICNKQFRVSQGLVRHLKETHERIKNFKCDICDRSFTTKRNVEEHRRIHTNERPYICEMCGKSFKQKASLFVHNRSHSTEFPFTCTECPQKFKTKAPLVLHASTHTGEKPFSCDICGRNFRIKYELKRHKLIHSEDKPFKCDLCGLVFRQKRYLRNHYRHNHANYQMLLLDEFNDTT